MISQHAKWWRVLYESGLLDRLDAATDTKAKEAATASLLKVPMRTAGSHQMSYIDYRFIPRVQADKFMRLLDRIEKGDRTSSTMEALASFYIVGIATPIVTELAEFCRSYTISKEPDKEDNLMFMIHSLRDYVSGMQQQFAPYPYFNENKWQSSMEEDFHAIATDRGQSKIRVPKGYPCIVRCRLNENGEQAVKTAYLFVNGRALAFTVPWIHSASDLPREFKVSKTNDSVGLFGILNISHDDLDMVYKIGMNSMRDGAELLPDYITLQAEAANVRKQLNSLGGQPRYERALSVISDKNAGKELRAKAKRFVSAFENVKAEHEAKTAQLKDILASAVADAPHKRMSFYPLDILFCKTLEGEVTRTARSPYEKIESILKPIQPKNVKLDSIIRFNRSTQGRLWQLI